MKYKNCYIYKEKVGTIGKKLTLFTAFSRPKTKSRSGFIAESTNKDKLVKYLEKRGKC